MKVLGIFWGIFGPLLWLFCLAMSGDADKARTKFMAQCRTQNFTRVELEHIQKGAAADSFCRDQWAMRR